MKLVCVVGPTGCGKTTIIRLLMRFYDCTSGHIFVDGRDVRSYDPAALRRRFGVVFQNDAVFADTLAENIRFGRDVDDEQLAAAAADAGALPARGGRSVGSGRHGAGSRADGICRGVSEDGRGGRYLRVHLGELVVHVSSPLHTSPS